MPPPPKTLTIPLTRSVRVGKWEAFTACPLRITLTSGDYPLTEITEMRAELHPQRRTMGLPALAAASVSPSGGYSANIDFTAAQLNQDLGGSDRRSFWLLVRAVLTNGGTDVFELGTLDLVAHPASDTVSPPPAVAIYATTSQLAELTQSTDRDTVIVSQFLPLDSDMDTGGGTDVTATLNELFQRSLERPTRFVFDGVALTSDTLVVGGDAVIECRGGAGIFKAANSPGHILTNRLNGITRHDRRIEFVNLTVNGNSYNQASRYEGNDDGTISPVWKVGLWFAGLQELVFDRITIRNAKTFAIVCGGVGTVRGGLVESLWDQTPTLPVPPNLNYYWGFPARAPGEPEANNHDGFHFWGDNDDVRIDILRVRNGDDDPIGFNCDENWNLPLSLPGDSRRTDPNNMGSTNPGHLGRIEFGEVDLGYSVNSLRFVKYALAAARIDHLILRRVRGECRAIDFSSYGDGQDTEQAGTNVLPIGTLEIDDWDVKGYGNIMAGSTAVPVGKAILNRIAPGCTARVVAAEYAGDYYQKPVTAAPCPEIRKALAATPVNLRPWLSGQTVYDLETGTTCQVIDRAATGTDAGFAVIGSTTPRAPVHAWLFNVANGSCPDLIGSANMVSSAGTSLAAGAFGNGLLIPPGQYARATVDMHAYAAWTIAGWFQWTISDTGQVQVFIEYADGVNPVWVAYGEQIQRAQRVDMEPIFGLIPAGDSAVRRTAYASNNNGIQRYRETFIAVRCASNTATVFINHDVFQGAIHATGWQGALAGTPTLSVGQGPRNAFGGAARWDALALWDTALSDDVIHALARLAMPGAAS